MPSRRHEKEALPLCLKLFYEDPMVEKSQVEEAQRRWAKALLAIGEAPTWEEAHALANTHVAALYALEDGKLLFCPTRASTAQFRRDLKSTVSYFVGQDSDFPEDKGFALQPWQDVRFENADILCQKDTAMVMGNYFFTDVKGPPLKIEFSFAYLLDGQGTLKIRLHHSALPYRAPPA